jgi:4a-hydroxytetrahydrobiopterin dehydratase
MYSLTTVTRIPFVTAEDIPGQPAKSGRFIQAKPQSLAEETQMSLAEKHCVPCEGGTPPLDAASAAKLLGQVRGWARRDEAEGPRITKRLVFKDFVSAMAFLDKLAVIAEAEGHHPDFCVHYNRVDVTLWTHAVGGLSENDFILASKIDALEGATHA